MLNRLKEVVAKLRVDWEAELIEMNGEEDHVHFLLGLNAKCAPSVVANNFKTVTSRLLRKEFPALRAKYREPVLWSRSYSVASVGGAPLSVIKQYIEQQARPLWRASRARCACAASPPSKRVGLALGPRTRPARYG
jgi:putative transposase